MSNNKMMGVDENGFPIPGGHIIGGGINDNAYGGLDVAHHNPHYPSGDVDFVDHNPDDPEWGGITVVDHNPDYPSGDVDFVDHNPDDPEWGGITVVDHNPDDDYYPECVQRQKNAATRTTAASGAEQVKDKPK